MGTDPFDLARFLLAQEPVIGRARAELATGHKRSHWMWFVFPQLAGLGSSPTAQRYALSSLDEARAYLGHPVLGQRLRECTALVNAVERRSIEEIFGYPDHLKFHSCVTLFAHAAGDGADAGVFRRALARYFAGEEDRLTLERLSAASGTAG